ncbi:hypothetical protein [Chitinimonas lacunae]|uniref:Type II secretion system protein GspC N-terminal domain-containing protein n=1 Tax=Chitinimonas lacunae TaxID=1963018 RepID=A0ABV8MXT1_9NEIS
MKKEALALWCLTASVASIAGAPAAPQPPANAEAKPKLDPSIIYQKNAFDPARKPWTLPVPPPPPPPPPPPLSENEVRVQGIIVSGTTKKALVELLGRMLSEVQSQPGKPARPYKMVSIGDTLGGYQLVDIQAGKLVFEQGGFRSDLSFKIAQNRPAAGITVPPPEQVAIVSSSPAPAMLGDSGEVAPPPPPMEAAPAVAPEPNVAPPTPAPTPSGAPPQGMTLMQAIEWAKKNPSNNANPFTLPPNNNQQQPR